MIVKMDKLGRIVIPFQVRRLMGVESGDSLFLDCDDMGVAVIRSIGKDLNGVKAILEKVVDNAGIGVRPQLALSVREILRLMEMDNK